MRCARSASFLIRNFDDVGWVCWVAERGACESGCVDGDCTHCCEQGDHEFVAAGLAELFVCEIGLREGLRLVGVNYASEEVGVSYLVLDFDS